MSLFGCVCFSMYECGFSVPKMRQFACLHIRQDQNELHLKRWFFFTKMGPFPSIVQAYTQSYSFGGRIKLIICQIRHELSAIIHEISTSWKKSRCRIQYLIFVAIFFTISMSAHDDVDYFFFLIFDWFDALSILPRLKWASSEKVIFFCQNRHLL